MPTVFVTRSRDRIFPAQNGSTNAAVHTMNDLNFGGINDLAPCLSCHPNAPWNAKQKNCPWSPSNVSPHNKLSTKTDQTAIQCLARIRLGTNIFLPAPQSPVLPSLRPCLSPAFVFFCVTVPCVYPPAFILDRDSPLRRSRASSWIVTVPCVVYLGS